MTLTLAITIVVHISIMTLIWPLSPLLHKFCCLITRGIKMWDCGWLRLMNEQRRIDHISKAVKHNNNIYVITMSNADESDDIVVDRSCIGCDKCGVGSPQKCCSRCGSFYYCRYVAYTSKNTLWIFIYQLTHNTHHLSSYFTLILSTSIVVIYIKQQRVSSATLETT